MKYCVLKDNGFKPGIHIQWGYQGIIFLFLIVSALIPVEDNFSMSTASDPGFDIVLVELPSDRDREFIKTNYWSDIFIDHQDLKLNYCQDSFELLIRNQSILTHAKYKWLTGQRLAQLPNKTNFPRFILPIYPEVPSAFF